MKKLLLFLVTILLPMVVCAYDACIDGIYYNFRSDHACVTYYDYYYNKYGYSGNIVIPETVTYNGIVYPVTEIGYYAFRESPITSVTIPNSITSIESEAFASTSITSIIIPNSVNYIGGSLFKSSSLRSIKLSTNLNSIPGGTFYGCTRLSINIPNHISSIGAEAFANCGMNSIIIPNSVTSIGNKAFANCNQLESVTFGTGLSQLGDEIFRGHTPSKVIWLSETPPTKYEKAKGTVNYVTNDQYSKINYKIYPYLNNIFESEGIRYVPINPSERTCDALDCVYDSINSNLTIGKTAINKGIEMTVENINQYTFYGNPYIKDMKWKYGGTIPNSAFRNCKNLCSIEIDDKTISIEDYAFADCESLVNPQIGSGVIIIGDYAFCNCIAMRQINIPKSVARIYDNVFKCCSELATINIEEPESTDDLHKISFDDCFFNHNGSVTYEFDVNAGDILAFDYSYDKGHGFYGGFSVYINGKEILDLEQNVTSYYICIFEKSQHVKFSMHLSPNTVYNSSDDFNKGSITNIEIGNDYSIILGANNSSMFSDCPLDSVYIGRSIKYLTSEESKKSPFSGNKYLRTVSITNRETEIYENEFYGCTNLKNISMGEDIANIGNRAFSGCIGLVKFVCGNKVQKIGKNAFSGCSSIMRFISHAIMPPICDLHALDDINKWDCTLSVPVESTSAYQQADQWKDFFFINNDLTRIRKLTNDNKKTNYYFDINGRKLMKMKSGLNIIKMGGNSKTKKIIVK